MTKMIEIVAKAICKRRNTKQCAAICLSHSSLNESCNSVLVVWGEDAKAAIAAMREPTEKMIVRGSLDCGASGVDTEYTKDVWQAMIDAALKE